MKVSRDRLLACIVMGIGAAVNVVVALTEGHYMLLGLAGALVFLAIVTYTNGAGGH